VLFSIVECYLVWDEMCSFTVNVLVQVYVTLVKERKLLADEEMIWHAYMIKELVMVRDAVCCLSSDEFFRDDVLALIFNLSVS